MNKLIKWFMYLIRINRLKKKFISRGKIPIYNDKNFMDHRFLLRKYYNIYNGKLINRKFLLDILDNNDLLKFITYKYKYLTWYDKNGKIVSY